MADDLPTRACAWRHILQRTFLGHGRATSEEISTCNAILSEISVANITAAVLRRSKLHIVLNSISDLADIPQEDDHHIKAQATALIETWKSLSDSPILPMMERKASQAAQRERAEQDRIAAAEAMRVQQALEAAVFLAAHSRKSLSPPLPPELLTKIFKSNLRYYDKSGTISDHDFHKVYKTERELILRCCMVSKEWSASAKRIMYTGQIYLYHTGAIRRLIRTVQEDADQIHPIQHLQFSDFYNTDDFQRPAAELIALCPELATLGGYSGSLYFDKLMPLPEFTHLRELRVSNQVLSSLAPLLHRLPILELLEIVCIIDDEPPRVTRVGAPLRAGLRPSMNGVPPPVFNLKTLRLSQCQLTLAECRWLFSSSNAIDYAQLQEIHEYSVALGEVIGSSVSRLHIKGMMDVPQRGDPHLSQSLSLYTNLKALQISGKDWPWTQLLGSITSSLHAISISYSAPGTQALVSSLSDHAWQKDLETVTVYHWANVDYFYGIQQADVDAAKESLEVACGKRGIPLIWIKEGESRTVIGGITEADLAP